MPKTNSPKPGRSLPKILAWFFFLSDPELMYHPKAKMQKYFAFQSLFGSLGCTFTGGVFLMAVYKKVGMDNDLIAYATSVFPTLVTGLIFFFSSMIGRIKTIKAASVVTNGVHKGLLSLVVLVPFVVPAPLQMYAAIGLFMLATLVNGANTILINTLFIKTIPNAIRGRSVAVRSNLGLLIGLVLPIAGTLLLDGFPDEYSVIVGLYAFSAFFAFFECWSLYKVNEVPPEELDSVSAPRFRDTFLVPLKNKPFLKYAFSVNTISYLINLSASFGTVYLLNVLGYSYSYIQIVSMICSVAQLFAYKWAGRLADRYNPRFIYYFGFIVYVVDAAVKGFTPGEILKFFLPLSNVMLGVVAPFYAIGTYKRKYELIKDNFGIYDSFSSLMVALLFLTIPLLAPALMKAAEPLSEAYGIHGYRILYMVSGLALFAILSVLIVKELLQKPDGFMDSGTKESLPNQETSG